VSASRVFSPERLRSQREAAGFTRAQVAIAICRSWGAVYQFERGLLTPGAEALLRMADLFGCPLDAFYEEKAARV
jgi:transcriptional regulator with XRE-family HTH domain